jgi:hypothetical protein
LLLLLLLLLYPEPPMAGDPSRVSENGRFHEAFVVPRGCAPPGRENITGAGSPEDYRSGRGP